ncbi:MAG: xanthine dehydrogenase family protein molybdopterin-binding subunit, partial [Delftia acidovorans]|nr:xanthine dehydrogenase family protein molybdopterin-binding subunit [Delftia acidovorans]
MNLPQPQALHAQLLTRADTLLVVRQPVAPPRPAPGQPGTATDYVQSTPEVFVAVLADEAAPQGWRALAFNGHVDLSTGIRTALAQIVAEELEVPLAR